MDVLFFGLSQKLNCLISDLHVNALIEQVTSVRSPELTEYLIKRVSLACKLSRPETSLNIVKFMYLYGKKDTRFFTTLSPVMPSLVLLCYQTAADPESLTLYVESWRMNNQWRDVAERCLSAIALKGASSNHAEFISSLRSLLRKDDFPFLLERFSKNQSDPQLIHDAMKCAEIRLNAVIQALNLVESIS